MQDLRKSIRGLLKEAISLDVKPGDVILTGRFKNKRRIVKTIGTDKYGQPTINGKSILKFKIEKKMPKNKWSAKSREELKEEAQLRKTVRSLILEGLRFEEDLMILNVDHTPGLFLLAKGGYPHSLFLFDYFYENHLLGMVQLKKTEHECYGSKEVKRAAARNGYGPTIYDCVMELTDYPLINDRDSVSRDAKNLMSFYKDRRPDVNKYLLDNIDDDRTYPRTEDTLDDCMPGDSQEYWEGWKWDAGSDEDEKWEGDPLSYAYDKPVSPKSIEFKKKGDEFIEKLNIGKVTLRKLGSQLFIELYH